MSNYIEPEMEKVKLEEENLENVSGGIRISKGEEFDGKYCAKIKTEGNEFDNIIVITGEGKSECSIKCENERLGCTIK